jgi:hypothetical protein
VDDQLAGGAKHAEPVPRHAEVMLVGVGLGLDCELVADGPDDGVQVHWDALSGGVQVAAYLQLLAAERGAVGDEADLRVVGDVEEVAGAQVGVALLVVRVEARRVDRQFDRGCLVQLEGAS